jgi:transposase-like protein
MVLLEAKQDERGRRITPAAEREALVRAYPESGLTQKAFAKKEGVKYSTFVSWVQAQRRQSAAPVSVAPTWAGKPMPRGT